MQSIDTIRLSEKQKQQLVILKRKTGIENWNVLCRWALCMSLAEPTSPPKEDIPSDSNVEMTWKTFTGEFSQVYSSIIMTSYSTSGLSENIDLYSYFKNHLSRGINLLLKVS